MRTRPALSSLTLSVIALLMLPVKAVGANSVGTNPPKTTTLYSEGELANDRGTWIFVGRTANGSLRRALIQPSIPSLLQNSEISRVVLTLEMDKTVSGPSEITLHRLTEGWNNGRVDAEGEEGTGAAAEAGSTTWSRTNYPDEFWTTPGGSFVATPSAILTVDGPGAYAWESQGLIEDILFWRENPEQNFGWILIGDESKQSAKRFFASSTDNSPRLFIVFTPQLVWAGFPWWDDAGSVHTGSHFLGWINVVQAPWIFSYSLDKFVYLPEGNITAEGAWMYVPRTTHTD